MLEAMMVLANRDEFTAAPWIDPALREARTCYDHWAGRLGAEAGEVTQAGNALLACFGIAAEPPMRSHRLLCLDWSERRPHLAGVLGAALCRHCEELGWIRRERGSRAVTVTEEGRRGVAGTFGLSSA